MINPRLSPFTLQWQGAEPYKVLVCGSREWRSETAIRIELSKLPRACMIIHGGARGADLIAAAAAPDFGHSVRAWPVDWEGAKRVLGLRWKFAGLLRNQWMLDVEQPDLVLAFLAYRGSRGTEDMIARARLAGVPVRSVVWDRAQCCMVFTDDRE